MMDNQNWSLRSCEFSDSHWSLLCLFYYVSVHQIQVSTYIFMKREFNRLQLTHGFPINEFSFKRRFWMIWFLLYRQAMVNVKLKVGMSRKLFISQKEWSQRLRFLKIFIKSHEFHLNCYRLVSLNYLPYFRYDLISKRTRAQSLLTLNFAFVSSLVAMAKWLRQMLEVGGSRLPRVKR